MSLNDNNLRSYYEEEARLRTRSALVGRRLELRNSFIERISGEGRHSIVDFGAGPGGDGPGFTQAGYSYVGLDLSFGNCMLAAEAGTKVIQGSLKAPPFSPGSFDAAWSMSTIMHLPEHEIPEALAAMGQSLKTGAPFMIGVWGAEAGWDPAEKNQSDGIDGFERLFSLRSFERNKALASEAGAIEEASTWPVGPDGWEYHTVLLRL